MTFESLTVLVNKELDRNKMKDNELYMFEVNKVRVLAWLENEVVQLKKLNGR